MEFLCHEQSSAGAAGLSSFHFALNFDSFNSETFCSFNVLVGFLLLEILRNLYLRMPWRPRDELPIAQISPGCLVNPGHQDAHPLQRQLTKKGLKE